MVKNLVDLEFQIGQGAVFVGVDFLDTEDFRQGAPESVDQRRVEMLAGLLVEVLQGFLDRYCVLVRADRNERIEDIGDGNNPSFERDVLAFELLRIAAAVPLFVVGEGDDARGFEQLVVVLADDFGAHDWVLVHDVPFCGIEFPRFEQDGVGDADLADVVHRRGVENDVGGLFSKAVGDSDDAGVMAHAQHVVAGLVILEFGGPAKTANDLLARREQLVGALADHAFELARLVVEREVGAHAGFDDGRADRLGDVIDRTGFQATLLVLDAAHGGDENDRNAPAVGVRLEAPADFQAAQAGHHDVEQDEVGRLVGIDDLERLLARRGDADSIVVTQHFAEQIDVFRAVVDDQDALFGEQGGHELWVLVG